MTGFLEEGCWKRGGDFLRGLQFLHKNKLKSEIFTKNLVTFKRWDGVKDEKCKYYEGSLKNLMFRGVVGSQKNQYVGVNSIKRGLGQFANLRGAW